MRPFALRASVTSANGTWIPDESVAPHEVGGQGTSVLRWGAARRPSRHGGPVVRQSRPGRSRRRVGSPRRQSPRGGGRPPAGAPSADLVARAPTATGTARYDRTYTPPVTPWAFLGRAPGAGRSCRAAVARPNAR